MGTGGTIVHHDGQSWKSLESGTKQHLTAVWGSGKKHAFAVGHGATALHFDGQKWKSIGAGLEALAKKNAILHGVWGTGPKDVWAVGNGGLIVHYDGKRWRKSTTSAGIVATSVWSSGDDAFVAGWDGTILHRKAKTPAK